MGKMIRPSLNQLLDIGCDIKLELEKDYGFAVEGFHEQLAYALAEEFPEWIVQGYSPQVLMLVVANAEFTRETRMFLTAVEQLYLNGYLMELSVFTYNNDGDWQCMTYLDIRPTDFNPNPVYLPQEIFNSNYIYVDTLQNITASAKLALAKIQSW